MEWEESKGYHCGDSKCPICGKLPEHPMQRERERQYERVTAMPEEWRGHEDR